MDQLLDTHGEIIMTFLLPKLLPSSFVSFMIVSKRTYELVNLYIPSVKHGKITGTSANRYDTYVNGTLHGKQYDGNNTRYYDGLRHGKCVEIGNPSGSKLKTYYKHGLEHGREVKKNNNGSTDYEYYYYNGLKHGMYVSYDTDGNVVESAEYVDGELHGMVKTMHDGSETRETYRHGILHGPFSRRGRRYVTGQYRDDQKHGRWVKEHNDYFGTVIVKHYFHGQLHGEKTRGTDNSVDNRACYDHGKLVKYETKQSIKPYTVRNIKID